MKNLAETVDSRSLIILTTEKTDNERKTKKYKQIKRTIRKIKLETETERQTEIYKKTEEEGRWENRHTEAERLR